MNSSGVSGVSIEPFLPLAVRRCAECSPEGSLWQDRVGELVARSADHQLPRGFGCYSVPAVVPFAAVVVVRQRELPDGAAARAESHDPPGGADAIGAEVEIAIRPDRVHVGEIEMIG